MTTLVLQELAISPNPNCPRPLEFDVSPSGLSIREGQGKAAARKDFPIKCITYVVKIRYSPYALQDEVMVIDT